MLLPAIVKRHIMHPLRIHVAQSPTSHSFHLQQNKTTHGMTDKTSITNEVIWRPIIASPSPLTKKIQNLRFRV